MHLDQIFYVCWKWETDEYFDFEYTHEEERPWLCRPQPSFYLSPPRPDAFFVSKHATAKRLAQCVLVDTEKGRSKYEMIWATLISKQFALIHDEN